MTSNVRTALAAAAICLAAVSSAAADPNAAPVKDWSMETVVVTGEAPGPAMWHIAKGDGEVWIVGTLGPVPDDLKWDTSAIASVLDHARALLLPPRGRVGIFEGIWFLLTDSGVLKLGDDQHLEAILPEPQKSRFIRDRQAAHRDADHYEDYKPSVAGFMLEGDFLKANDLSVREPESTFTALASRKGVSYRNIANYPALAIVKEVPQLSREGNLKCLTDALDDIDVMKAHAKLAAEAWAVGNLDGIKAHYSEPNALDCLGQSASFNKLWQQSVGDTVGAIDDALGHHGKTIVVVNIGELLRKNGVLERLRAQGLQIEGPGN